MAFHAAAVDLPRLGGFGTAAGLRDRAAGRGNSIQRRLSRTTRVDPNRSPGRECHPRGARGPDRGDLDRVASYWTDDVTIRRALGQPVEGAIAARKIFEPAGAAAAHLVYRRSAVDVEVSANWPLAYEAGVWSGHLGYAAGPVVIGGRYAAQWVKRDGRWLIRSEVFVALTCEGIGCGFSAAP